MIRDLIHDENGAEGVADFPLIDEELYVIIGKNVELEYAEKCIGHLQTLTQNVIEILLAGAIKYCEDYRKYFAEEGLEIPENMQPNDILPYIHAGEVYILERPKDANIPAFSITLNCDWEREHAMEWVVRGNEVIYVGPFNGGISPWDEDPAGIAGNYV